MSKEQRPDNGVSGRVGFHRRDPEPCGPRAGAEHAEKTGDGNEQRAKAQFPTRADNGVAGRVGFHRRDAEHAEKTGDRKEQRAKAQFPTSAHNGVSGRVGFHRRDAEHAEKTGDGKSKEQRRKGQCPTGAATQSLNPSTLNPQPSPKCVQVRHEKNFASRQAQIVMDRLSLTNYYARILVRHRVRFLPI